MLELISNYIYSNEWSEVLSDSCFKQW